MVPGLDDDPGSGGAGARESDEAVSGGLGASGGPGFPLSVASDPELAAVSTRGDPDRPARKGAGQVADDRLDDIVAENAERNTDFMKLYFDNNEFQKAIKEAARRRAYRIITEPARDEALARLRAEMRRETGGHPAGE